MPRRKKCPICNEKVISSIFGKRKAICSSFKGREGGPDVHYWYQYPVEIIRYGRLDFYIHQRDNKTYVIEISDLAGNRINNHLLPRPLYTCEECIEFSRKWDKLAIFA